MLGDVDPWHAVDMLSTALPHKHGVLRWLSDTHTHIEDV